jgi:Flp pilus assembly pilin Flp
MLLNLKKFLEKTISENGQGLIEYALIVVLIVLVVLAAIHTVGNR